MSDGQDPRHEPVGNLGEEAVKLLGALSDWASDHARDVNEHLATGDAECTYCPICRTVHALRTASPEVRAQLTSSASTFLQAAAGLLSSASAGDTSSPTVQRIDLDDLDDDEDLR
jgi:hypothetical protein